MQKKNIIFIIVLFFIIGFFLFNKNLAIRTPDILNIQKEQIGYVEIAGKTLKVDLALDKEEQKKGLSGRKDLKEDEGMLFVFDHIGKYSFWMKDMNFPIDIIWIGEDLSVVFIKKNANIESYLPTSKTGPEIFTPDQDARYVLEVLASFSEKNNLKVGDKVKFLAP